MKLQKDKFEFQVTSESFTQGCNSVWSFMTFIFLPMVNPDTCMNEFEYVLHDFPWYFCTIMDGWHNLIR